MQARIGCARVNGIRWSLLCPPQPPALPALGLGCCSHWVPVVIQGDTLAMLCHSSMAAAAKGWCQAKLLCLSWGGHTWGSPAQPGGPSGQWVLNISWSRWQQCQAVPEPPTHPSLPVLTQGDTSWPGHPASRWPLPTACSVWHHLPSPPCPSCVGTASLSF